MDRYFALILARDRGALRSLQKFELDLFPQTAKRSGRDQDFPFSIDGLLTTAEIETLVKAGYKVQINESADQAPSVAEGSVEFPEWLAGIQEDVARERAAAVKTAGKNTGGKKK